MQQSNLTLAWYEYQLALAQKQSDWTPVVCAMLRYPEYDPRDEPGLRANYVCPVQGTCSHAACLECEGAR